MQCTHCQTPLPDEARFCFTCGSDLSEGGTALMTRPRDLSAELQDRLSRILTGRYVVRELLGAGGMGAVFLADDLTLERTVAIKVLPPEMSRDERVVTRFQREAKTAAKLDHRHIIPIYRVESEGGLNYFVMKYVAGRSLESVLADGSLAPFAFATRVLGEAAAALGHAHTRGVVHRDVKPANIMLEADDCVMLTDFGISKAGEAAAQLTHTGVIVGTPYYMAPEQAMGLAVDGRADQYALGVVGYQMLTGQLLFTGESAHTIIYRHVSDPAPRASSLRPELAPHLDAAIARALSKQPEERFSTMEEFAAALGGARPVTVSPNASRGARPSARTGSSAPTRVLDAATVRVSESSTRAARPRGRAGMLAAAGLLIVASAAAAMKWVGPRGSPIQDSAALSSPKPVTQPVDMDAPSDASASSSSGADIPPANGSPAASRQTPAVDTSVSAQSRTDADAASSPARVNPAERQARRFDGRGRPMVRRAAERMNARRDAPRQLGAPSTGAPASGAVAPLTVASEPYGTLYVDGVEVGDTPVANYPIPVGRRVELRVERDGYRTKRETILVAGPNAIRRRFLLEPGEQE